MPNLLGIIILLAIVIWVAKMLYDKKKAGPETWPDLPAESQEVYLPGMPEPMFFPQYGYYRFRNIYYKIVQRPCIFTGAEAVEDQIAYAYRQLDDGSLGYAPYEVCSFLGREKPKNIVKF